MGVGEFILWLLALGIFRETTSKVLNMIKFKMEYKQNINADLEALDRFIKEDDLDE